MVCSFALVASTIVLPATNVSAETAISFGFKNGYTAGSVSGKVTKTANTYVTLTMDGMYDAADAADDTVNTEASYGYLFTTAGELQFLVTKDVFSSVAVSSLGDNGLVGWNGTALGSDINLLDYNDEYDLIKFMYSGSDIFATNELCDVIEFKLTYADATKLAEADIIPLPEKSYVQMVTPDGEKSHLFGVYSDGQKYKDFTDMTYKYTIAGTTESTPSNVVTKTAIGGDTITKVGDKVYKEKDDEGKEVADTTDLAVAYTVEKTLKGAYSKFSVTGKFTDTEGNKVEKTSKVKDLEKAIPEIDAKVVIGVIVQIDGSQYTDFELTSLNLQ